MESLFSNLDDLMRMSKEKAEKNLRECVANIKTDFAGIIRILSLYHPLEVLKLSVWEARRNAAKKDIFTKTCLNLMPFLLQSLVTSNLYDVTRISQNRNIKPKDWNRLVSLTEAVTRKLLRYIDNLTVINIKDEVISKSDADLYRQYLGILYFPPFESKERIEQQYYPLRSAMSTVGAKVKEKFGVSADELAAGYKSIAESAIDSIDNLIKDVQVFKGEVMEKIAERKAEGKDLYLSEEALTKKIIKENGWEGRSLSLAGKRDDFDLFRPEFYTELPKSAFDGASAELGSLDIYKILLDGYWPASLKPFIKMGDFYFSFISKHLVSCGNRILMEAMDIYDAPTRASEDACSLIFTETDAVDVYSFEGHKIDLIVLPSMTEANPDTNPAHFSMRAAMREEERNAKRQLGHVLLFVDPDSTAPLEKIGENSFTTSTYYLIYSAEDKARRRAFLSYMFGILNLPESEKTFAESIEEDYFLSPEEEIIPDPDDDTSDDYEYALTEEEEDQVIKEKEEKFELSDPELIEEVEPQDNIEELREIYELTEEIIQNDNENSITLSGFAKEIDYDDFAEDEEEIEDEIDYEASEDEAFYNEAEAIDEYEAEPEYEPETIDAITVEPEGQLDFLNLLDDEAPAEKPQEEESIPESAFADEVEDEDVEDLEALDESETIEDVVVFDEDPSFADEVDAEEIEDLEVLDAVEETEAEPEAEEELPEEIVDIEEETPAEEADEEVVELDESEESAEPEEQEDIEAEPSDEEELPEEIVELDEPEEASEAEELPEEIVDIEEEETPEEDVLEEELIDDDDAEEKTIEIPLFAETEEECIKQTEALKEEFKDDPLFTDLSLADEPEEESEPEIEAEPEAEAEEELPEEIVDIEEEVPEEAEAETEPEPAAEEEPVVESKPAATWADMMFGDILNQEEDEEVVPVEEEPAEVPAEETPVEEAPVEEAPVEEAPVEEAPVAEPEAEIPAEEPEEKAKEEEPEPYFVGEDGSTVLRDKDGVFILRGHASTVEELLLPVEEEEEEEEAYEETLDGILLKIKRALNSENSVFLSFLEDADDSLISYLHGVFSDSWNRQQQDHKDKVFSIYDYSLTVLLARNPIRDDLRLSELLNNAGAVMYSKRKEEWNALILYINDEYSVETAIEKRITKNSFSAFDWKRVTNIGEQLISRGRS